MKIKLVKVQINKLEYSKVTIIGRIRAISTSKIKKIMAIKKNRIEKGDREEFRGLNPHSKGEGFSWSKICFFLKSEASIITTLAIIKIIKEAINKLKIIYIKLNLNLMIGSHLYFLYYINLLS